MKPFSDSAKPVFSLILAVFFSLTLFCPAPCAASQKLSRLERSYQEYQEINQKLVSDLQKLQILSLELGETELQKQIETKLAILQGEQSVNLELPREIQDSLSHDLTGEVRALHLAYRNCCQGAAQNLYQLSKRVQSDSPTFTFELLNLILNIDSDHATSRALRGYVRQGKEWLTPFERDQRAAGRVEHPRFGWLPKDHVDQYNNGRRSYMGNWISAAKESEIRRDFRHAWEVQTENFHIKTNVSLEHGVEMGRKLEIFYRYFKQTFALFYNSPEQLRKLLNETDGRSKPRSQLYEIHFFRDKQEYVNRLQKRIPQIAITNGLYQLEDRVSYFYYDPDSNNDATVFHEATHQLMYESHFRRRDVGQHHHFWIVEGIACYMESFKITSLENSQFEVGDPRFVRFHWARHRVLQEEFYVPLERFSHMGRIHFQTGTQQELQRLYSQASGLSHFFMHYEDGKYRDALMLHMAQVYHSNPRVQISTQGLDKLTGVSYSELDRQYHEYMEQQQAEVEGQPVIQ